MKRKKGSSVRWFGDWANEYDSTLGSMGFHCGLLDLVVSVSGVRDSDRVLDIGCGTGLLSLRFLRASECSVVGVDNSREMIGIFREKIEKLGIGEKMRLSLMDASSLRFGKESFDVVASTVTLHHLKDKLKSLKTIHKILRPSGKLVIGDIDMDTTGKLTDERRMRRILDVLADEWISALKESGIDSFERMFDNGKKHILNDGEYCIDFKQWSRLCKKAGFKSVSVKSVPGHSRFKVLLARK